MRKKCNLWMFLAIASIGMHFYRTLQTINNISIPTNSQQNDNMLVEQMVSVFTIGKLLYLYPLFA